MARMSRREFIRLAGNTVAGGIGYPVTGTVHRAGLVIHTPAPNDHLATFDYVVVLMMENRSFDNLLGYLYEPGSVPRGATFAGVAGQTQAKSTPMSIHNFMAPRCPPPTATNPWSIWWRPLMPPSPSRTVPQ